MSYDREAEALKFAHLMLHKLSQGAQERALAWLAARFAEDRRGCEAAQHAHIEPTDWVVGGDITWPGHPTRDDLAVEHCAFGQILEAIGRGTVRQCFGVCPPAAWESAEIKWFATRAEAERYLALLQPPAATGAKIEDPYQSPAPFLPDHLGA